MTLGRGLARANHSDSSRFAFSCVGYRRMVSFGFVLQPRGAGRGLGIRGEMHARHGEGYDVIQVLYLQGEAGVGN